MFWVFDQHVPTVRTTYNIYARGHGAETWWFYKYIILYLYIYIYIHIYIYIAYIKYIKPVKTYRIEKLADEFLVLFKLSVGGNYENWKSWDSKI